MKPLSHWFRDTTQDIGLRLIAALGLLLYLVFIVLPVVMSLRSSFTDENPLKAGSNWIGLSNYSEMLHDSQLRSSLLFTLALAAGVTVVANVIGLAFAMLLDRTELSYRVLRTIAFLPQVISGVIVGFVWKSVLTQDGLLNNLLMKMHLIGQPVDWLGKPHLAQLSVGIVAAWVLSGFATVVYLAALQSIPRELYDAGSIDGASTLQQFRAITLRMVAPATTVSVTISLITVLKLYDIIQVLTSGGPAYATQSTAQYIVQVAFTSNRFGYASAIAMFLLALSAVISLSVTSILRRREVEL
ncbi:sugar ABC transporter permease [Streptomyces sp. NBC_01221]|uniref:carbohydrate ABC transporter permease n=1 Tax=Streptomyces sp. NBC_01221 TaxID=2903782 RepID=UPI00225B7C6A|nr:sugar ABC transporter permease [Streptomyces sp. NBC_01221]MCX4791962.1 sugar ABC transporter permease [Streptomyces sp. NBC_01221]